MIQICKAKISDVEHIIPLWRKLIMYHKKMIEKNRPELDPFFVLKKDGEKISSDFIKRQIRSKNGTILIAKDDEWIVGYTNLIIENYIPLFNIDKIGEIIALFIDEEYRGKKVSTLLFHESIEWFKQKKIKHVMLNVFPDNHQVKEIYEHLGFSSFLHDMRITL